MNDTSVGAGSASQIAIQAIRNSWSPAQRDKRRQEAMRRFQELATLCCGPTQVVRAS